MKSARFSGLLRRRNVITATAILFLGLGSIYWMNRNYHFRFDSHEDYDTSFYRWTLGWFDDFDSGPLSASLIPGPQVAEGNYSRRDYRWYLHEQIPSARLLAFLLDEDGIRFTLSEIPGTRELLFHCWSGGPWEKFDYQVEARHVSNDPAAVVTDTEKIGLAPREALTMMAWDLNWIDLQREPWSSRLILGEKLLLPGKTPREDWSIQVKINGENSAQDRIMGEFVIAYDWETNAWRIFDRDWHEFEAIDSWIRMPTGYAPNDTVEGFTF